MLILVYIFVFGLVFGSFLNVLIYRWSHNESPFKGRSICPNCRHRISWQNNIPLVSFFYLRGKCAHCKHKISWHYPLIELLTGSLFIWWYVVSEAVFTLQGNYLEIVQPIFWLTIGMLLMVVFFSDLWFGVIPDIVNGLLLSSTLLYRVFLVWSNQMQYKDFVGGVVAGVGLYLFFYFLVYITAEKGFGWGDVKLAPSLGLLLGWQKTIIMTLLSFVIGSLVALPLLLAGKKKFGQTIPMGPFLVTATFVALVYGEMMWKWYRSLM